MARERPAGANAAVARAAPPVRPSLLGDHGQRAGQEGGAARKAAPAESRRGRSAAAKKSAPAKARRRKARPPKKSPRR